MKRAVIFAHYDRNDQISDYVIFYLEQLKKHVDQIVFVSTARLSLQEQQKVSGLVQKIIVKDNVGYDFKSWQVGLSALEGPAEFDEILICNDSVYGPFRPLAAIFDQMEARTCDFWGMTSSLEQEEHLQSYFIAFRKNVIKSKAFQEFWQSIEPQVSKHDVVSRYEIGLSRTLRHAGFRFAAVTDYKRRWFLAALPAILQTKKALAGQVEVSLQPISRVTKLKNWAIKFLNMAMDPTCYAWRKVIDSGTPFLKVKVIRDNPLDSARVKALRFIASFRFFPVELIERHIASQNPPKVK